MPSMEISPSLGRPRAPQQARSQQKVAAIIAAAEAMIIELGPEAVSLPELARTSGVLRSSVYQFFPDKYALFGAIAERHLTLVAQGVSAAGAAHPDSDMAELVHLLVNAASDYYDATPVAGILVLGGPFSQRMYLAQTQTVGDIGSEVRRLLETRPRSIVLPVLPDAATLSVEIAFACMKHGYYRDGELSHAIRREAARAATAYLSEFLA